MTREQRKFLTKHLQNNTEIKCYGNVYGLSLWSLTREGNIIWVEYEKDDGYGRRYENISDFDAETQAKIIQFLN